MIINVLYIAIICYLPIVGSLLPRTNFGAGIPDIGPVHLASYATFLLFSLNVCIKKSIVIRQYWIINLTLFTFYVFISISWSAYSYSPGTLSEIFNSFFIPMFLSIICINIMQSEADLRMFVINITVVALLLSCMSLFQMITALHSGTGMIRSTGTFEKPNALAIFLVLILPWLLYGIEKKIIPRFFGLIACLSLIGGVICSLSRKGVFTMILCFAIYFFLKEKIKWLIYILFAFVLIAVVLAGYDKISDRFTNEAIAGQLENKWSMTYAGLLMFADNPVLGHGYKGYKVNYSKYFPDSHKKNYDAHNIFITVLSDYGSIGIFLFLTIFLYPIYLSLKNIYSRKLISSDYMIDLSIICISSVVPFIISGWFAGGLLFNPSIIALVYTTISIFVSMTIRETDEMT